MLCRLHLGFEIEELRKYKMFKSSVVGFFLFLVFATVHSQFGEGTSTSTEGGSSFKNVSRMFFNQIEETDECSWGTVEVHADSVFKANYYIIPQDNKGPLCLITKDEIDPIGFSDRKTRSLLELINKSWAIQRRLDSRPKSRIE